MFVGEQPGDMEDRQGRPLWDRQAGYSKSARRSAHTP